MDEGKYSQEMESPQTLEMPQMPQMPQMPYPGQMPYAYQPQYSYHPQQPMMCCPYLMSMQCPMMGQYGAGAGGASYQPFMGAQGLYMGAPSPYMGGQYGYPWILY